MNGMSMFSTRDETILPNTKNVGLGLTNSIQRLNQGIDPSNFLKTNTLGIAPINTELTIKYLIGGGVQSNVNQEDLTTIKKIEFEEDLNSIPNEILTAYNDYKRGISVKNIEAAIAKGVDPVSVKCAYETSSNPICITYAATSKK